MNLLLYELLYEHKVINLDLCSSRAGICAGWWSQFGFHTGTKQVENQRSGETKENMPPKKTQVEKYLGKREAESYSITWTYLLTGKGSSQSCPEWFRGKQNLPQKLLMQCIRVVAWMQNIEEWWVILSFLKQEAEVPRRGMGVGRPWGRLKRIRGQVLLFNTVDKGHCSILRGEKSKCI